MIRNNNDVTPDIRRLYRDISSVREQLEGVSKAVGGNTRNIQSLLITRSTTPAAPVANLLWNGEIGHSVHTWHDATDPSVPADKNEEAAWFFSHNKPAASQTFTAISVANQIPLTAHEFTTGCTVDFLTTGTLPTGLALSTTYFAIYIDANTISVATSVANAFAGTAVAITVATGSGTHTIQQQLLSTDARTSSTNNELKSTSHTTYNFRYSRWDEANGQAQLTGTMTVDVLLSSNMVDATTPLARVSLIAAKRNSYIEIPDECLFGCGVWDNTSGQRKFLTGDIGFEATLDGAAGTVERRYRALLSSDRGFQILSPEITIANGPSDAQFSSTRRILMSWLQQSGQLQVELYEYLPAGGSGGGAPGYRLLTTVSSATSYIHQGSSIATVGGYPTPTGTQRTATFYTLTGEMSGLGADGSAWSTINFPNGVPNNYNKGNTTNRQWMRLWLTVAPNLFIEDCTTDGTDEITAPATAFDAEYDTLWNAGDIVAEVYDSNDTLIDTLLVLSRVSDTVLQLDGTVATGTERKLRLVGAGFHGVLIDKVHLGFHQNTAYAPNALDSRTLNPVAAPSSSNQGGVGDGGTGGGIDNCIAEGSPVKLHSTDWQAVQECSEGELWASGELKPNVLTQLKQGIGNVRRIRAANGVELECTDSEAFIVETVRYDGVFLRSLRIGDPIVTEIDGRIEISKVADIGAYLGVVPVYTPSLSDSHLFIAGRLRLSVWQRVRNWLRGQRQSKGGFVLHNSKPYGDGPQPL